MAGNAQLEYWLELEIILVYKQVFWENASSEEGLEVTTSRE
jgi:hypothetical protein